MFCRIYCDEPEEDVTTCEALTPQLIRMHVGISKHVNMCLYECCGDEPESYDDDVSLRNARLIANTGSTTEVYSQVDIPQPTYTYTVKDASGTTAVTGTGDVGYDKLFDFYIGAISSSGYYTMTVVTSYLGVTSSCLFPIFVCA